MAKKSLEDMLNDVSLETGLTALIAEVKGCVNDEGGVLNRYRLQRLQLDLERALFEYVAAPVERQEATQKTVDLLEKEYDVRRPRDPRED